jgi:protein-L-isoaspartate(D-aspartate) O-methyltransferase
MNIEQARFNMVEQQIRTWDVLNPDVLNLLMAVKREEFVPEAYRALAFVDTEIPLQHGQFMMPPRMEARIIQALRLKPTDRVLEIGTGSGYLTALLAKSSAQVATIELYAALSNTAAGKLARAGIGNVECVIGDAARSPDPFLTPDQRFDAIVLTGSTPVLPEPFLARLAPSGRLFAVVGDEPAMRATLYTKSDAATTAPISSTVLFETVLAPLENCVEPSRFSF